MTNTLIFEINSHAKFYLPSTISHERDNNELPLETVLDEIKEAIEAALETLQDGNIVVVISV